MEEVEKEMLLRREDGEAGKWRKVKWKMMG